MASITFDRATRRYPGAPRPAVDALDLDIADGEFLVLVGPVRLRQVHQPADARRAGGGRRRGDPHRRARRHPHRAQGPRHRHGLPELRPLPAHVRRRQHGLRAEDRRHGQGRDPHAGRGGREDPRPHRLPRPQAQGPLRRAAPARRHGPRDRPPAAVLPDGRAAVQPGREAARADPHPDRRPAAPPRRHHRLRHPRPGRGHDHGRPRRPAQGRAAPAGRQPAQPLRPATQHLRRRLHRLTGDEPRRGQLTAEGARVGDYTVPIPRAARTELADRGARTATLGFRPSRSRSCPPARASRSR